MTIDKAIEDSKEAVIFLGIRNQPGLASAVQLGIEALNRYRWQREHPEGFNTNLLPGETKD